MISLSSKKNTSKKIILFASGSGTNAENIIKYFQRNNKAEVVLVLSNKKEAGVLARAKKLGVKASYFTRKELYESGDVLECLREIEPDLIVLAGFLWIFPPIILEEFSQKVINIHPALLPKYGGKGMYGMNVHQAVVAQREMESGISIHYVNEVYDQGKIIFQKAVPLTGEDTPEAVAQKIHALEYEHFPQVIEKLLYPGKNE